MKHSAKRATSVYRLSRGEAIRRGQFLEFLAEQQGSGASVKEGIWPERKTVIVSGLPVGERARAAGRGSLGKRKK